MNAGGVHKPAALVIPNQQRRRVAIRNVAADHGFVASAISPSSGASEAALYAGGAQKASDRGGVAFEPVAIALARTVTAPHTLDDLFPPADALSASFQLGAR